MKLKELKEHIKWLKEEIRKIEDEAGHIVVKFYDPDIAVIPYWDFKIDIYFCCEAKEGVGGGAWTRSVVINGITGERGKVT